MKNWLTSLMAGLLVAGTLVSCDKDETKVTVTPSNALTVTASATSATLLETNGAQEALTYTWTPVQFTMSSSEQTTPVTPKYIIQFARTADGFGFPTAEVNADTATHKTFTVSELNAFVISPAGFNLTPGTATTIYARVVASLGASTYPDKHTFASEPMALTVTPYELCAPPSADVWSLIGPAGTDWSTDIDLTWSCTENAYIITRDLNAGEFKFRLNHDWAVNLGTAGSAIPVLGAGSVESLGTGNPPNLSIGTAGTYTLKLTVDAPGGTVSGGTLTVSQ